MTLTKNEIIDQVRDRLGFSRKQSIELVEMLIELIKKSLESGDDVLVSGFGKFCVKDKKERKGRKGKTVTTISGLQGNDVQLKKIASEFKSRCGTGGSVKDGIIIIQGDHRETLKVELEKKGFKARLAGG